MTIVLRPAGGARRRLAASFSVGAAGSPADFAGGAAVCYQAGKPSLTAWYGPLHFTLGHGPLPKYGSIPPRRSQRPQHNQALNQRCLKLQPAPAAAPRRLPPVAQSPLRCGKIPPRPPLLNLPESIKIQRSAVPYFGAVLRPPSTCSLMILPPLSAVCSGTCAGSAGDSWHGTSKCSTLPYSGPSPAGMRSRPPNFMGCHGRRQQSAGVFFAAWVVCQCDHCSWAGFHRPTQGRRHISGRLHTHLFLLLWLLIRLLFRLGKDPQLQPAHIVIRWFLWQTKLHFDVL